MAEQERELELERERERELERERERERELEQEREQELERERERELERELEQMSADDEETKTEWVTVWERFQRSYWEGDGWRLYRFKPGRVPLEKLDPTQ